ncbi:MAG: hypothetical protein U1F15_08775 [Burkholderiales bacterium]
MTVSSSVRRAARALAAVLLLSVSLVRPASAVNWTDIWYAVPEIGAGYNFVQSDSFIFATFFVHAANLEPDWYTGQMTANADGSWSGGLYRTTGSYFGGPYIPAQTNTVQVGNVKFTPTSSTSGLLEFNVGAVTVSKVLTRLSLTSIALGGDYLGGVVAVVSKCNDANQNGTFNAFITVTATQVANGALTLDLALQGAGSCRFTGNYEQNGVLTRIPNAAYTCGNAFSATAAVSQITSTAQGIEGQWVANVGGGCQENGYFSAVLK